MKKIHTNVERKKQAGSAEVGVKIGSVEERVERGSVDESKKNKKIPMIAASRPHTYASSKKKIKSFSPPPTTEAFLCLHHTQWHARDTIA